MSEPKGSPRPDNHVFVLFGATGDLAKRKLLPGLFHLHAAGLLPRDYRAVGTSPPQFALTEEEFPGTGQAGVYRFLHHQTGRSVLAGFRAAPVLRPRRAR